MSTRTRLTQLERTLGTGPGTTATVLITDYDGADFLASPEGIDYSTDDDLVITTGIFTNHKFTGCLTDDDETAIANLREANDTVIVYEIDGYHLRLIDKAYRAAIARTPKPQRLQKPPKKHLNPAKKKKYTTQQVKGGP